MKTKAQLMELVEKSAAKKEWKQEFVELLDAMHTEGMNDAGNIAYQYMTERNFLLRNEVLAKIHDAMALKPSVK